ncbi:MAG: diacylglycerol kinase [Deltaproteobacteria bacterium]|nr:diacylglycerol kinase [Deltaproteobacteria bacterium]HCH63783.1 dihydrofolate reductase [Deltaproteobacteria bacterium]
MSELTMVVAVGPGGVIGRDGDLPWRIREDLRHFKRITMGHTIIMGRRTWDSIGRPLPGRQSVVLTRNRTFAAPGAHVVHSLADALALAEAAGDDAPCIIGGAALYAEALPLATRMEWTEVDQAVEGDTFFPPWDRTDWTETARVPGQTPGVTFCTWRRRA